MRNTGEIGVARRVQSLSGWAAAVAAAWCAIFAGAGTAAAAGPDPLAGTWTVTLISDDSGKTVADVWTIKTGDLLTSAWAAKQGVKDAVMLDVDTRGGQSRTFTGAAKGTGGAEVKWTGTAALGEVTGTVTLTKADGSTAGYTYKGTRAAK